MLTDDLEHLHKKAIQEADRLYQALNNLCYEGKASFGKNLRQIAKAVRFLELEFLKHICGNEEIIFPYLQDHIPRLESMIEFLKAEHAELRQGFKKFNICFKELSHKRNGHQHPAIMGQLKDHGVCLVYLLRNHLRIETESIYNAVNCELKSKERQELTRQMAKKRIISMNPSPILPFKSKVYEKSLVITAYFLFLSQTIGEPHGLYEEKKPKANLKFFKQGEALYQRQCAICHGVEGAGDGKASYLLFPKPRNFVSDKFRLISTTSQEATEDDLFEVISRGMAGSSMPSWGQLAEKDRWALMYYVRYLSEMDLAKKRGEVTEEMIRKGLPWKTIEKMITKKIASENMIKIPAEPTVTPEAIHRGQELFVASCAGCHGVQGRGDGQQKMTDSLGYPTQPRNLTAGIFKADSSSEELYFRMMAGMPGSPMPSYNGVFTQEQIWDLIHFVQSLVPEGVEEKTRLKHNAIVAQKVSGEIDRNPLASLWQEREPVYVALTPLWWRDERIEAVKVRAVHNGKKVAFHLTWEDPNRNDQLVEVQSFTDGAALQFSTEKDPPFFGMGSFNNPVNIWHWKAAWEKRGSDWQDIESQYPHTAIDYYESQRNYQHGTAFESVDSKTSFHDPQSITGWGAGNPLSDPLRQTAAEEGTSEGLGTYTAQMPKIEGVDANGVWDNGRWYVVFTRTLNVPEKSNVQFRLNRKMSIAFAVWDGAQKDRNGQKSVSIWNSLVLKP